MAKRKICVVTGSRSDYGHLFCVMKEIQNNSEMTLQVMVTGMHLSPEFGLTFREIEKDGFQINAKVEMLLSSDTSVGVAKSIGLGVIGFAGAIERLEPDMMILFGDRYEILAAAEAALVSRIPVSHIAGGDTTEGAFDEAIRHCVTKMSHLHFVTNAVSAQRVRQMGENPDHIFNVGSTSLDYIKRTTLLLKEELEASLSFQFRSKNLLITFHPVTLDSVDSSLQFKKILDALNLIGPDVGLIFTRPNSDVEGRKLSRMIDDFVIGHRNAVAYTSMGQLNYWSTMAQIDAVVGNSSSGIYEAPYFKKPTINIGDRQKGRLQASSVINIPACTDDIVKVIEESFKNDYSRTVNPYGNGNSSWIIVKKLNDIRDFKGLLRKHFHKMEEIHEVM